MTLSSLETSPASHSTVLRQALAVCRIHSVDEKIVFVPYQQVGGAIESGVGRSVQIIGGMQCITPYVYAQRLLKEQYRVAASKRILSSASQQMIVGEILESEVSLNVTPSPGQGIADLCSTLTTLRLAHVDPSNIHSASGSADHLLHSVYSRYIEKLKEEDLWDETTVFRKAAQFVAANDARTWPFLAICSELELSAASLEFVDALLNAGSLGYLFTTQNDASAPRTIAGNRMRSMVEEGRITPVAPDGSFDSDTPTDSVEAEETFVHVQEAVGPVREVRSVLRSILSCKTAFEDVEIAYTTSTPYLSLLVDEAERAGIPTTCGTGLPVSCTLPGQLLIRLCRWIEEGYPAAELVHMLRGGLLRTSTWMRGQSNQADEGGIGGSKRLEYVSAHRLASILAEGAYGDSLASYEEILTGRLNRTKAEAERLIQKETEIKEQASSPESSEPLNKVRSQQRRIEKDCARLETTLRFIEHLQSLFYPTRAMSVDRFSSTCDTVLRRFGRTYYSPPDTKESSDDGKEKDPPKTYDQMAKGYLLQEFFPSLERADRQTGDSKQPIAEVARFVRLHLEQDYVGAQKPLPGHVHILPLDSAGFGGRSDLYVVGMDSESTDAGAVADPLLGDTEREQMSTERAPMKLTRHEAEASAWRAQTAIMRHNGRQQFTTSVFDPVDGEERFPSTLYLTQADKTSNGQSAEDSAKTPRESLAPPTSEKEHVSLGDRSPPILLSDAEAWLAAPDLLETSDDKNVRTLLFQHLPWIRHGEIARQMRASDEYTEYDGLLPEGRYPDLDIFLEDTPTVSASRLQTFAMSPYAYFIKYVLGVRPLDEPALNDEPWLTALRKGSILHNAFERMMKDHVDLIGTDQAHDKLAQILKQEVDRQAQTLYLSPAERQNVMDGLRTPAKVFLQSEQVRADRFTPKHFEWGFGHDAHRRKEDDVDAADLEFQNGHDPLPVRGQIDRIDLDKSTHDDPSGPALWIWDYKSGSTSSFDVSDPLQKGKKLQWILYAQVARQKLEQPVLRSGYFFPDVKEMGRRLDYPVNVGYRSDMEDILIRLGELSRTGTFPMSPNASDADTWKYGDYEALVPDIEAREAQLQAKDYPEDWETLHAFDD